VRLGVPVRDDAGALDRTALADHIFAHPDARETLEGVLHPAVREQLWLGMQRAEEKGGAQWVVLDVPLLREGGLDRLCDRIVHVEVPAEVRCARACERHGWSAEQWRARESAQMQESEKAARADAILANHAGLEALSQQVEALVVSLHCLPPRTLRDRWPAWNLEPSS
ncbi:MAG: dephospho-CoA kinase, partial [Planctomycetota bacterium]